MTSGLDLIAGVAGAELLGAEGLGESTASNEEEDEFEDDLDRDKKPGCKFIDQHVQQRIRTVLTPTRSFLLNLLLHRDL